MFTKWPNSVIANGEAIPSANDYTNSTDYEGELAVIIGEGGRNIGQKDAYKHVYGYTIVNDVTARTLQQSHKQWFLGKSLDGYCPMGPAIVTADDIDDKAATATRGWFITIDGPDGGGKTTQAERLVAHLRASGRDVRSGPARSPAPWGCRRSRSSSPGELESCTTSGSW